MFNPSSNVARNTIIPLAISQHAPTELGELQLLGYYRHTINFLTKKRTLLSLHCFGKGLPPSGWLLKSDDFNHIHYLMRLRLPIHLVAQGIYCNGITITQEKSRKLQLTPRLQIKSQTMPLQKIICQYDKPTGLYGTLATLELASHPILLRKFGGFLHSMLQQTQPKFSHLLGEGPGLTPSSDDILTGLIAYAFTQPQLAPHLLSLLMPLQCLSNLTPYTTLMSSYFISQASVGLFATSILHVLNSLNSPLKLNFHVQKLLNYGHTSGADILVGLCIAEYILNHP